MCLLHIVVIMDTLTSHVSILCFCSKMPRKGNYQADYKDDYDAYEDYDYYDDDDDYSYKTEQNGKNYLFNMVFSPHLTTKCIATTVFSMEIIEVRSLSALVT